MKAVLNTLSESGELSYRFVTISNEVQMMNRVGSQTLQTTIVEHMGYELTVIYDEEGATKSGSLGRLIADSGEPFYGNIIITGDLSEDGELPDSLVLKDFYNFSSEVRYVHD